jgi:hypothetical protein
MKLPNPEQAVSPFDKIESYSLNQNHSEGQHKAIVFQAVLGIGLTEAEILRSALQQAVINQEAILAAQTLYGQKYRIDFEMTYNDRQAMIRSIWIARQNEDFPRLVTCYIL